MSARSVYHSCLAHTRSHPDPSPGHRPSSTRGSMDVSDGFLQLLRDSTDVGAFYTHRPPTCYACVGSPGSLNDSIQVGMPVTMPVL